MNQENIETAGAAGGVGKLLIAVVGAIQLWQGEKQEQAELEPQISAYREMIGTSLDVKRAELVMFNT